MNVWKQMYRDLVAENKAAVARMERAEAERDKLKAALEQIAAKRAPEGTVMFRFIEIAKNALES